MNYEAYFQLAKHYEIPFTKAFQMLCNLHTTTTATEDQLLWTELEQYQYGEIESYSPDQKEN
jgi:hypothetical protein